MGKRRLFDEDVSDVFRAFGLSIAVYFEALRYRQQLKPGHFFAYPTEDITKNTGLSYKQQLRAHKVLKSCEWIETDRVRASGGGTVTIFRVTELAYEAIKDTRRKRGVRG